MRYDGRMYSVWRNGVGIAVDNNSKRTDGDQAYPFTVPGDDGHCSAGRLTAYMCLDTKKYSDEVQKRARF